MTERYHFSVSMSEEEFITFRERLHRDFEDVHVYRDRTFTDAEEMSVDQHSDSLAELVPPRDADQ